jgi:hypothetical protein
MSLYGQVDLDSAIVINICFRTVIAYITRDKIFTGEKPRQNGTASIIREWSFPDDGGREGFWNVGVKFHFEVTCRPSRFYRI